MKKWLIACMLLSLAACIPVDDFGEYWSKMTADPALQGRWAKLSDDGDKTTGQEVTVTLKDGAYEVQPYSNGAADGDPTYPVKTFTAGSYHFVAVGPSSGDIIRYTLTNGQLQFYVLNPQAAWEFIEKNYPQQQSMSRDDPEDGASSEEDVERPLAIESFDDQVITMFAAIPNTRSYWEPDARLKKAQ